MKKLFYLFICLVICCFAKYSAFAATLDKEVKKLSINDTSTVAVYIKDLNTGFVDFKYNEKKLLHPASTLKLLTTYAAVKELGTDYTFKTSVYVDKNKNVYLQLGADPMLNNADIKNLVSQLRHKFGTKYNNFYIDSSIVDEQEWGIGWMWDDSTNVHMPKFSAYNLDGNLLSLTLTPTKPGAPATMTLNSKIPFNVINQVKTGKVNDVTPIRNEWMSPDILVVNGTVNSPYTLNVPLNCPKRYFMTILMNQMYSKNFKMPNSFLNGRVPKDAQLIATIERPISAVVRNILWNSDNLSAETLFKVAGGHYKKTTGTIKNSVEMFNNYYKTDGNVIIADGSGVSRNNLVTAEFMGEALYRNTQNKSIEFLKEVMVQPADGTMTDRLVDLRGSLWTKTGTLSGASGIVGIVETKKENKKLFVILIQNHNKPENEIKKIEDDIILKIYNDKI